MWAERNASSQQLSKECSFGFDRSAGNKEGNIMKDSNRSKHSEWCIEVRRRKFHILKNFNIFIHLFLLQMVTEPLLSARHYVWYQKKTQEPCSSGTYSQVEETIASGK